jgi:flagellar basal-body rod protein FlgB
MDAGVLPTDIGVFRLAERRLAWAGERQAVLAQNVANANTPGYQPRDIAPFAAVLGAMSPGLAATDPGHMQPAAGMAGMGHSRPRERAPDGNAVSLEDQLMKVADTSSAQELVANLYRKYQGLFRTALGRGG